MYVYVLILNLEFLTNILLLPDHFHTAAVQVAVNRNHENLFLSLRPPHAPVGSKTLARWLTELLTLAGINTAAFQQHATRSASAAYHRSERMLSIKEICQLADWSETSGVYELFYQRFVM